jgi:gag-polypeptide of LTR copia-type
MANGTQQNTPATTPTPSGDTAQSGTSAATTSTKYAFKQIPTFNPTYYRRWASDVQDAFGERRWTDYLTYPPAQDFEPDNYILVRAKAFISQAIPYEHGAGIEGCTTAAEIFNSLQQHFGSASREDELRLESQLMTLRKIGSDNIDQHIAKVEKLIAAIMAQQAADKKYDNDKRNQLFLQTITHAKIEGEDWSGFVPYLGRSWHTMTPQAVFAEARIFYNSRVLPNKTTPTPPNTSNAVEGSVYMTQGRNANFSNRGQPHNRGGRGGNPNYNNNSHNRSNHGNSNYGNSNYKGNSNYHGSNDRSQQQQTRDKYDPTKICQFHGGPGHSTEVCRDKFNDPKFMEFYNSQSSQSSQQLHPRQSSQPP